MAKGNSQKLAAGSAFEFEAQLWAAADKMRGHMDADTFRRDLHSFELDRPMEKDELAAPRQMAISFHYGAFYKQIRPNYGIPI